MAVSRRGVVARLLRHSTPRGLRNWVRNPRASLGWLRSQWDFRRGRTSEAVLPDGLRLRCHPESAHTFALFTRDPAQGAEYEAFCRLLGPAPRLLDLGAHYGFFGAVALARSPEARVLAVEPSAGALAILKENLRLAGGEGRAQVLAGAVGAGDGELAMLAAGPAGEQYMFAATGRPDAVRVPQFSLASLGRRAGWTPTLVKCDIEGHEAAVLQGENLAVLAAWRVPLLLELHRAWIRRDGGDPEALLRGLAAAGYRATPAADTAAEVNRLVLVPR
ncbi:MAG TPA: FkbM family methyltransferase [Terriglobales bacterium]|nr:FkbM family methyltransferase [Terriglobales bacterium]